MHTVFPLISTLGAYQVLNLFGVAFVRGRPLLEGDAYFKVREMNNIKCQNLIFLLSK